MGKSIGRRAFEVRERLPNSVKRPLDGAVKFTAKVTRGLRDQRAIERNGKATVNSFKRKILGK